MNANHRRQRVRVKVCGVVTPADALAAVEAGADLIGFNFVPESKRFISLDEARTIAWAVREAKVETVALFRNAPQDVIAKTLQAVPFDWVQFHGEETPEEIGRVEFPVIRALRGADAEAAERFPTAVLLLDHPQESGGGGQDWDWSAARPLIEDGWQVILAGGLNPENVEAALGSLGGMLPWAVDVASGVEFDSSPSLHEEMPEKTHEETREKTSENEARPDGKDPAKMKAFIKAVRSGERRT